MFCPGSPCGLLGERPELLSLWCLPQNGPSPSKAWLSCAAASKRLLLLSGSSMMISAMRIQTASQPSRPASI